MSNSIADGTAEEPNLQEIIYLQDLQESIYRKSTGNFKKNEPNLSEIGQAVQPQRLVKVGSFSCALKRNDRCSIFSVGCAP